jgi:hypothetical protein
MESRSSRGCGVRSVALGAAILGVSLSAGAFTFTDGKPMSCVAAGQTVPEVYADTSRGPVLFTGRTERTPSGFQITWNAAKLNALPPDVHDYIFFHECAHARVPTIDEIQANCAGLIDMRAAGRAGPAVEAKLAAFYGPGSGYWAATVKCANGGLPKVQ